MPVYFEYFVKVSLCLAVTYFFYILLLKQMTYYTWNRYFLLFFSILSFIVPVVNVNIFNHVQQAGNVSFIDQLPSLNTIPLIPHTAYNPGSNNYLQILFILFALISFILVIRLLLQLLSILKVKAKATIVHSGDIKIYHVTEPVLPFSFLNNIFINKDQYNENELNEIIEHELVHAKQKHTIDVLIAEVICILNWYNPVVWLIKKAVRENLEFIADDAVIKKGINRKSYQYLLLKVTGESYSSIATSLKFSSLKNRIVMMNKTKTSRFQLLKFVLLIPVIVFLLLAFRNTKENSINSAEIKNTSAASFILSTLTYSISNEKVKAIVIKEKNNSLLQPGELLNLSLIYNEKDRLKSLLERNGYNNLKSNAIRFMIDTASVNNSFSIEIKIDVEPSLVYHNKQEFSPLNTGIITLQDRLLVSIEKVDSKYISPSDNTAKELNNHLHLNTIKTNSLV